MPTVKPFQDIAVMHLVRSGNSHEALERFLDSYIQRSAGITHRLVFLLKGFKEQLPNQLVRTLGRVPHSRLFCPDRGYDVASYFYAAKRTAEPLIIPLNSYSVLLGDDWLEKLFEAYRRYNVGLVGATGSFESLSVDPSARDLASRALALALHIPLRTLFPAFPNVHIRTNGFLINRRRFLAMRPWLPNTKLGAWQFESGRRSLTQKILQRQEDVLLVGRDGSTYAPPTWSHSRIFWQAGQENLLIQDNRTENYATGDNELKAWRRRSAWKL